jgi:uncharacterized integral membrane protein (TIGR00698 family)
MTAEVASGDVRFAVDDLAQSRRRRVTGAVPGLAVAALIAVAATIVGRLVPIVGAPVTGIVIGFAIRPLLSAMPRLKPGIDFARTFVLQLAVVVLGSQLSLRQVVSVGASSLPVLLGTLAVCLLLAYLLGRRLGVSGNLSTLVGVGTGICGASAIAAVSPVITAASAEIAVAISTIFLFNVVAVLTFPAIGHLLGLSQHAFGLFAGTAVNDTSSVVAAATSYGADAGHYAVVVKLTRTLMIIPICLFLAGRAQRRAAGVGSDAVPSRAPQNLGARRIVRLIPWFLIGFILVAGANSAGLVPSASHGSLQASSLFLITMALSAIGVSTDVRGLVRAGYRPLLLGLGLWVSVGVTSLALQLLSAQF